jgi:tetratricopeptide (TPR) repeat protein/tRNA A-37 threonylcarbamoyl transferase component Bud32
MEQTRVGHYRIERHLAAGGMGAVYEATDLKLGRRVALKFMAPGLTAEEENRKRFEREAKSAAALNHPHIATLHALERDGDRDFIAMELLSGPTLRALLSAGHLEIDQATAIVRDVADALAYAHSRPDPVVHRDIKPENLMFDELRRVKITDFGLAKATQSSMLTTEGTSLGTPTYMAPECWRGGSGPPADVFALGAVFYELLVGRPPFQGESPLATMYAIANDEAPRVRSSRPDAPESIDALVARMLSKAPEERPTAPQVVAALGGRSIPQSSRIDTIPIDQRSVPSPAGQEDEASKRREARRPLAAWVILALATTAGLAIALVVWPAYRDRRHSEALQLNNRGTEALQQGRLDQARGFFTRALALDPSLGIAQHNLGTVYEAEGRIAQAESVYTIVLRRYPRDRQVRAQALFNLGSIDLDTGALESAVQNLAASFAEDSSTARSYNNYGLALGRQGRADEALAILSRGIKRFPVTAPLHKNMGYVLISLGRPREALPYLDRALAIDSTLAEARALRQQALRAPP